MICPRCWKEIEPDDLLHFAQCKGREGFKPPIVAGADLATYETSLAAAKSIEDVRETQRAAVEGVIKAAGGEGRTDDEVQALLDLDGSSERPRRWELWKLGRIGIRRDEAGQPVRRLTRTQRRAVVWIAVA